MAKGGDVVNEGAGESPLVSVCMIVRNEEALLPTVLGSVKGLADEVVIVDTGSTDQTVELAKEWGATVIEGADRMHKGAARNQSLDAATGDWCVVVDADEQVREPKRVREFLANTDAQAVYMQEENINTAGQTTLVHSRLRAWKRGAMHYKYRAHETPTFTNGAGKVARTDFVLEHRPPPERQAWKPQYFMDRLTLDVEENPGDGRPLFYLGRQHCYAQEWQKGADLLEQYLESPGYDRADALGFLARCYAGLEQKDKQAEALYRACAAQPQRRDWWGQLAELYHADGKYRMAIGILKCALEIQPNAYTYTSGHWHGAHIYDLMARCMWNIGRVEEGAIYARKAWELAPDNQRLQKNLAHFDSNRIKQLFDCIGELRTPMSVLYVGANRLREPECVEALYQAGHRLTLLEIWPDNADHYRLDTRFERVIQGDVRTAELPEFDAVFWWHGPEHVSDKDITPAIERGEAAARELVILATPWGYYQQGPMYGNDAEIHSSKFYPVDFLQRGYMTATQGEPDKIGSHILAWKRKV